MRRLALVIVLALTGCGGSREAAGPRTALLTDVRVSSRRVEFAFRSPPHVVLAEYRPRSALAECGSGRLVDVAGRAYLVVSFTPAATADIRGDEVIPTYTGPTRLEGRGRVLEAVKVCDFESEVGWAIGLEARSPFRVSRDGATVSVRVPT